MSEPFFFSLNIWAHWWRHNIVFLGFGPFFCENLPVNKLKTSWVLKVKPGTLHIFGTINTYVPTIPLHLGYLNLNDDVIISYFWYLGLFCETLPVSKLRNSDPLRTTLYTSNICDTTNMLVWSILLLFYDMNPSDDVVISYFWDLGLFSWILCC